MADTTDGPAFEALLHFLRDSRGFDFTGYKRPTLVRRVNRRMQDVDMASYEDYLDYLEVHPDEFTPLFNTILINVTRFFRDAEAWDVIAEELVPNILERRQGSSQPIRVWSAACSAGQEAYSIAMIFAEQLGIAESASRVKIYGTDVDEDYLERARQGVYTAREVDNVPPPLRERYFKARDDDHFVIDKELRRTLIFGRHDLVRDAPIGRLDLLLCRNTLMYFNAEVQAQVLSRFHFALRDRGYLVLGKAETLVSRTSEVYDLVDLRHRVFQISAASSVQPPPLAATPPVPARDDHDGPPSRVLAAAFDSASTPQVVVSAGGFLLVANQAARAEFGVAPSDFGRPFHDHELSYRPAELRSVIDAVRSSGEVQHLESVAWEGSQVARWFDIDVAPLRDGDGGELAIAIDFRDVSAYRQLQDDLQVSNRELETAYEELQSTNEELETTNEELQSTIEELETTNEELQSSNEELETMNEELQSTNAQLESLNDTLGDRGEELDRTNSYLRSILRSIGSAVVVLDRDLRIGIWSVQASELWGLRADEVVDRELGTLDVGLPVQELDGPVRRCLETEAEVGPFHVDARDRRGRDIRCAVTCTPLIGPEARVRGVVLLIASEIQRD